MNETILNIKSLNKSFGSRHVLKDVNLDIRKGRIIGLIGANGAGKTTIMKSILGITNFEGEISIEGINVTESRHQALKAVGALIEYPGLYPFLGGREQLNLFATGIDAKANVEEIISKLKMTSYANVKTKNYSLGMKQKLGVGLALLNKPDLVILDEPINGLDPKAAKELRDYILEEKENGITFLISSHILSELQRIADDVIIIDHGEIIRYTTMADLLASNKSFYKIKTTNDEFALQLLNKNDVSIQSESEIIIPITEQFPIGDILELFMHNKIKILNIKQQTGDLEESLLSVIDKDQVITGGNK